MESVVFDGKEYIKASVLAERFNYTQDYLGQLCRGKKVDARLVGRAWYINLDSLQGHRQGRYKSEKTEKAPTNVPSPKPVEQYALQAEKPHFLTRVDVEPVLKKKTVKILKNTDGKLQEYPVKYEKDDYSLIPKISREAVSKPVTVFPADAEDISVKATKESVKITAFKAEPLPEVYLKGKLRVAGLPEVTEEEVFDVIAEPAPAKPVSFAHTKPETVLQNQLKQSFDVSDNSKKSLKIKLYRKEVLPNLEKTLTPKSAPASDIKVAFERPAKRELPRINSSETISHAKSGSLMVKNIEKETVSAIAQAPEVSSRVAEEVPYATTKAIAVLGLSSGLIFAIMAMGTEGHVADGQVVFGWKFSVEQVQNLLATAIQKYL